MGFLFCLVGVVLPVAAGVFLFCPVRSVALIYFIWIVFLDSAYKNLNALSLYVSSALASIRSTSLKAAL